MGERGRGCATSHRWDVLPVPAEAKDPDSGSLAWCSVFVATAHVLQPLIGRRRRAAITGHGRQEKGHESRQRSWPGQVAAGGDAQAGWQQNGPRCNVRQLIMRPIEQLCFLSRCAPVNALVEGETLAEFGLHLATKSEMLILAVHDVDFHVAKRDRAFSPVEGDPSALVVDNMVMRRLQLAVEAIPHCVYSLCEVVARLMSAFDKRTYPRKFHQIATAVCNRNDGPFPKLRTLLGELPWYFAANELRSEWTHYAPVFPAGVPPNPLIIAVGNRRSKDSQQIFPGRAQLSVDDLKAVATDTLTGIDLLLGFAIATYVVPKLNPNEVVKYVSGVCQGRMCIEEVTLSEMMLRAGLVEAVR